MNRLMSRKKFQFLIVLLARSLDVISLFIILPLLFSEFGSSYYLIIEFLSVASIAVLFVKLGYDSLVIKSLRILNHEPAQVVLDALLGKIVISLIIFPLAAIYYTFFVGTLTFWEFLYPLSVILMSEVINTSQVSLIYKSAIWIFAINLLRIVLLMIGALFTVYFGNITVYLFVHSSLLLMSSFIYLILNGFGPSFWRQTKILGVVSSFTKSLDYFLLRIFSVVSDKVLICVSVIFLTNYNLILLDVFLRYLLLFSVPSIVFLNFARSREVIISIPIIISLALVLSVFAGLGFYLFLSFAGYLALDTYSFSFYFYLCLLMISIVFISQLMIFISDSVALNHDKNTGSKLINIIIFMLPVGVLILFPIDNIFFCVFVLHAFYLLGICSFLLQNLPEK